MTSPDPASRSREVAEDEIEPGVVLHLDPDVLEEAGGTDTCARGVRVLGPHLFLCIAATARAGTWLPLLSQPATKRRTLPKAGRTGHAFWTEGTFHFHEGQVWTAPHAAVVKAAKAGREMSVRGARNRLDTARLPRLPKR